MNTHLLPSSLPPHPQLGVLVSSYIRSAECVEKYGVNNHATLKPDGSTIVIAVSILTNTVARPLGMCSQGDFHSSFMVYVSCETVFLHFQTSKGHLLFLRVNYEKLLPSNQLPYVTREHGM